MKKAIRICLMFLIVLLQLESLAQIKIPTRVPSQSAGTEGITTLIIIPEHQRYSVTGAPVAVYNPGGFDGVGIGKKDAGLVDFGFIEIQFNYPGCGTGPAQSGGSYDFRGMTDLAALKDVLRFALGLQTDTAGQYLGDITGSIIPDHSNVGMIAYSNGGNTNICVTGIFGEEIPGFAWLLNWESPVGDGMPQAEAGSKITSLRPFNPLLNPAYNPDNGQWNMSLVAYDSLIRIPTMDGLTEVIGGLYWDVNGNDSVDPYIDYIAYPITLNSKQNLTQIGLSVFSM
jgi:hypothetical protein